ncbi:MAG TPA: hypothetical protein VKW06_05025 [Candidatus Angelobacter sp.]|nr:hypothetical protein [Candidatus Angelobacter sp.]
MTSKNRSVPVDTLLSHLNYQNLAEAMARLSLAFGFQEYYRYGGARAAGRCERAKLQFK